MVGSSRLEEKGPPKGGLFGPLKRNGELGLERRETVGPYLLLFFENLFACFWYEKETSFLLNISSMKSEFFTMQVCSVFQF